jgi:nitroreductase
VSDASPFESAFVAAVAAAARAPSPHNTQPARWRLAGDRVELHEDMARWLSAGDPTGRDHVLALGAAWEGMRLALAEARIALEEPRLASPNFMPGEHSGLRPVAHASLRRGADPDPLAKCAQSRRSYRGSFRSATESERAILRSTSRSEVRLIEDPAALGQIATLYDAAALACLRDPAFARELYRWMRFSQRDPAWRRDGMSTNCLGLSRLEAWGARYALRPAALALARALRLDGGLVSEAQKVRSATAIALFYRAADARLFDVGRALYRFWLELERLGFAAVPMSALVDSRAHREALERAFAPPAGKDLVTVLRVGPRPSPFPPESARLPWRELIV